MKKGVSEKLEKINTLKENVQMAPIFRGQAIISLRRVDSAMYVERSVDV